MIEVYCDESRPETIFSQNSVDRYMIIGGIWVNHSERKKVKNKISYLKKKYGIHGEVKWTKVSPMSLEFYKEVLNYFFKNENLRFRCIVVDSYKLDLEKYHNSDGELGFYKFYYELLNKWIEGNEVYRIYLDNKSNKDGNRLHELKSILNKVSFSSIESVLSINSNESIFVEIVDILIGAVGYKYHNYGRSEAKNTLLEIIENNIGGPISGTAPTERKFNVFKIILK